MDFIGKDILSGELVPVLLGLSKEASDTARRMFQSHGVVSHIFCSHIPWSMRLSLCMKFHAVKHDSGNRLMVAALLDFADQLENRDLILYLIPCTDTYANLIWNYRDELERKFVIADRLEMDKVWFGEPELKE